MRKFAEKPRKIKEKKGKIKPHSRNFIPDPLN